MKKPLEVRIMKYGPGNGWNTTTYRVQTRSTLTGSTWLFAYANIDLDKAIRYAEELINPVVVVPEVVWSSDGSPTTRG